jgi:hypothetical protein
MITWTPRTLVGSKAYAAVALNASDAVAPCTRSHAMPSSIDALKSGGGSVKVAPPGR